MSALLHLAALVALIALASPPAWSGEEARNLAAGTVEKPAAASECGTGMSFCERLCAPAGLVFLPCMAVGATRMPACREREITACHRACSARRSTC